MAVKPPSPMPDFQLVAHRGYPHRYPDNSLAGIRAALEAGATQLEVDIQLSASGTPWLFHDETLKRVCGLRGRFGDLDDAAVAELAASEAARFGEAFADEPVARLEELARELEPRPDVHTFVEIKPEAVAQFGPEATVDAVAARLERLVGQVTIISFSVPCLRAVAERTPHPHGLILERWSQTRDELEEVGGPVVFCNYKKLPRGDDPIDLGRELAVYEVVDPELALALGRRGAHYVETFAWPEMHAALFGEDAEG